VRSYFVGSHLVTIDKTFLDERIGRVGPALMTRVDEGLRLVLGL
jgi:mRNA-degrading endonuclease toxin of MazEF toxin-antitoxin module